MKTFCFTVDDNIRVFRELTESRPACIFDHPYLAMYRRLHEKFGLKVQLNLFYREGDFDLSQMKIDLNKNTRCISMSPWRQCFMRRLFHERGLSMPPVTYPIIRNPVMPLWCFAVRKDGQSFYRIC